MIWLSSIEKYHADVANVIGFYALISVTTSLDCMICP